MKPGMLRALGIGSVLLLLATAAVAQMDNASDTSAQPRAIERQVQQTQAELQRQRAQSEHLKARVSSLEQGGADNREQLSQRNREIAELQRKLDALSGNAASSPHPASGRSG